MIYNKNQFAMKRKLFMIGIILTLTLDASIANYLNSTGGSIYAFDGTYNHNIFGIGKDDESRLDQRIFQSNNPHDYYFPLQLHTHSFL